MAKGVRTQTPGQEIVSLLTDEKVKKLLHYIQRIGLEKIQDIEKQIKAIESSLGAKLVVED